MSTFESPLHMGGFNERRRKALLEGAYAGDRQQAMDEGAAEPLDAGTFWSEVGRAISHGAASAVDETIETGRQLAGEVAEEPAMQRIEERAAGVGESLGVAPQPQPDHDAEVTLLRAGLGLEPPTTAGGKIGAGFMQALTGMAMLAPAGPALGTGKLAAAAGKVAGKVAPKAAASPVAQAAGRGALEGQVMAGGSAFAAFDGAEKRMLVALNENPATERFVADWLASHDPDAGEWENRFYRMAEEGVLGGLAGAGLSATFKGLSQYVKAVRAGRPGHVIEGPDKAVVEDAQVEQAIRETVEIEQEVAAREVADGSYDYGLDDEDLEEMAMWGAGGEEASMRMADEGVADPEVQAGLGGEDAAIAHSLQMAEEMAEPHIDVAARAAAAQKKAKPRTDPTGPIVVSPADVAERVLVPLAQAEKRERAIADGTKMLSLAGTRHLATELWGATADTGLGEAAGPTLGAAQRNAMARLAEASVDPDNAARAAAAEQATQAWRRVFSEEWRGARGRGWEPVRDEEAWKSAADGQAWLRKTREAMRDDGRLNPELDEAAAPPGVVSVAAEPVSVVRGRHAEDFGQYAEDVLLQAQRPEEMNGLLLPASTRRVLLDPGARAVDTPVTVHFDAIHTGDDVAAVLDGVSQARAADTAMDHGPEIDQLRATTLEREPVLQAAQDRVDRLYKTPLKGLDRADREKLKRERVAAQKQRDELRDTQKAERDRLEALRGDQAAIERELGNARQSFLDLMGEYGYGHSAIRAGGRLREGVDPRMALHTVEAVTGSMQRMAMSASSDALTSAERAAAVRGLHKAEAVLQWLTGNDKAMREALRRGELPVEDEGLAFRAKGAKSEALDTEVARRWRDKRLVAQSGGTQRVQARLAGMALAEDASEVLNAMQAWRNEAQYAWGAGRRLGMQNWGRAAMQVRLAGMLSGVKTFTMNLSSTSLMSAWQIPEHFLSETIYRASAGDSIGSAMTNALQETSDMVAGVQMGARDAMRVMSAEAETWAKGESFGGADGAIERLKAQNLKLLYDEFASLDQYEQYTRKSVVGLPAVMRDAMADSKLAPLADTMDVVTRVGLTFGSAGSRIADMGFKAINYRMNKHMLVMREMRETMGPRTPANDMAWDTAYERAMRDTTTDAHKQSMRMAHVNTFTAESVDVVEQYVKAMKRYPVLRNLTPYVRTPANVLVEATKRMPVGAMLLKSEREAMRAGGRERAGALARQTGGAIVLSVGGMLFANGRLSGAPPRNEQMRKAWAASGKKPYSIKIGDTWHDYRQVLGHVGISLGFVADANELLAAAETAEEHEQAALAVHMARSVLGYAGDQTMLRGLYEAMEMAGRVTTEGDVVAFQRWAQRLAQSYVPNSAMTRNVGRTFKYRGYGPAYRTSGGAGGVDESLLEKMQEEWDGWIAQVKDQTFPWLGSSADQLPRRDHRGRPVNYHAGSAAGLGSGDVLYGFVSPMPFSIEGTDPLTVAEREAEWNPGWHKPDVRVKSPLEGHGDSRVIEMDRKELDYYARTAGQLYERRATSLVTSAGWQQMGATERRQALMATNAQARREVRQAMSQEDMAGRFPQLARARRKAQDVIVLKWREEQRAARGAP